MTLGTFLPGVVGVGIDSDDLAPAAAGVGKFGMAANAETPTAVNGQDRRVIRMVESGAVAVLTLDDGVRGGSHGSRLIVMALAAVLARSLETVADGKLLPILHVSGTMPAIHVAAFSNPEIPGYHKSPDQKYQGHDSKNHPQRPPDMFFHLFLSLSD
jgi:hypothetical protein